MKLKPVYYMRCRTSMLVLGYSKGKSDFMGLNMGTEFQFPVGPVQNTNVQISDIVDIAQITHVLKKSCCWLACFGRD